MGKESKKRSKNKIEEIDKTKVYKGKKKKTKHPKLKKILKIILIIFLLGCIIGAGVVAGVFLGLFGDEFKITKEELQLSKMNSVVKDIDGNIIANLAGDENRKIITKAEMPDYLPKAFVSIEDERFYKHHGVDIKRTAAATATYILHRGSSSFGGSTITQQLIKNLTNEKDDSGVKGILRKVKEMSKAYQVEKMISKDQILELYLNLIFLGDKTYGVEVASQYYFSKSAKELDLAECAFLAGINHSPNGYKPFEIYADKENAEELKANMVEKIKKRTKTVLMKMNELGQIKTEDEYTAAVAEVDAGLKFVQGTVYTGGQYSYHTAAAINQVKKDLMEKNGWNEKFADMQIRNGGYTIYTTQNTEIQKRIEEEYLKSKYVIKGKAKNEDGTLKNEHSQSAMVIIDYKKGYVVGTVGGLGTDSNAIGLNRATSNRQTGSSFKPLAVVAPGLENGVITAGTVYDDCATSFGGYEPENYNNYKGPITIRDAIETSQNIVPLKAMYEIGPANSIKFLRDMGFASLVTAKENKTKNDESLPLALGGLTNGATPVEMAAAYGTIANDGTYITPTFYTQVQDRSGNVILQAEQETRKVMSEQNAYIEKNILIEPVKGAGGTAKYCAIPGFDVAAKTGTTNDSKDRWLCGFTSYYSAAVWYGYDTPERVSFPGTNPAGQIWIGVMKDIHKDLEKQTFKQPEEIVTATICKDTGLLATEKCSRTYQEVFVKGTVPSEKCKGQVTVKICRETGKVANEFCPVDNVYSKTYTIKPPKEQDAKWKSNYGDKYGNPPTETCTVHVKPVEVPKDPEPPKNNTVLNSNTTVPSGGTEPPKDNTATNSTKNNTVTEPPKDNTVSNETTDKETEE